MNKRVHVSTLKAQMAHEKASQGGNHWKKKGGHQEKQTAASSSTPIVTVIDLIDQESTQKVNSLCQGTDPQETKLKEIPIPTESAHCEQK